VCVGMWGHAHRDGELGQGGRGEAGSGAEGEADSQGRGRQGIGYGGERRFMHHGHGLYSVGGRPHSLSSQVGLSLESGEGARGNKGWV